MLAEDFRIMPYWWDAAPPENSPCELPAETDVAIVGAGYCGLCAALELADNGVKATVLESEALGFGASSRNGGMVTGGQKFVVSGAIAGIDEETRRRILEDARDSLVKLEARVEQYGLEADYKRCGRVILASTPRHFERLTQWCDLLRRHTDATVEIIPRDRQSDEIGSTYYHGGLLIEDYGGLHPAKYHRALREAARARGVSLHASTPVTHIGKHGDGFIVETPRGTLRAREVFIATNGYTGGLLPYLRRRVVPVRSYVIATEPLPAGLLRRLNPKSRMFSDTKRDLFYFRLSPDGTRVIFGARPGVWEVDERTAAVRLHAELCKIWPEIRDYGVSFAWTGNVGMSYDKMPSMGVHEGVHYALACNGSGVAMMSYLGYRTALKILAQEERPCAFDRQAFRKPPLYNGYPWFLPLVSGYYRALDMMDRARA